ncbi:hypothetical protein GGH19_002979 [Coemansia sp. RSA 1807]|nr:hypothetical protein GGH19_002979 [Coemansia sp. RSA 1807]
MSEHLPKLTDYLNYPQFYTCKYCKSEYESKISFEEHIKYCWWPPKRKTTN